MSWIWWLVSTLGVAGTAIVIAGFLMGWPSLLRFFTETKIGRITVAIGAGVAALFLVFARGKASGKAAQVAKQKKADDKIIKDARDDQAAVDRMPIDDARRRLREQSRKH